MLQSTIIILALITALFAGNCSQQRHLLNIDTSSPGSKYRIYLVETHIKEVSDKDPWPYKVFMKAERNGQVFLQNEMLDHYDGQDVGLGQIVTDSEWLSDSILRLGNKSMEKPQQYDWIEVTNNSSNVLSYALISGINTIPGEKFLLFDLSPSEKIQIKAIAQTDERSDYSWINFLGKFETRKDTLISSEKSFKIMGKYKSPSHYYISVNDNNAEITSLEYESRP
jgi:hypothetical protein